MTRIRPRPELTRGQLRKKKAKKHRDEIARANAATRVACRPLTVANVNVCDVVVETSFAFELTLRELAVNEHERALGHLLVDDLGESGTSFKEKHAKPHRVFLALLGARHGI